MIILNALKICSNKNTRINWWGKVILEKQINSLDFELTLFESPKEPPIIKDISLLLFKEISSILWANSSEVYCLPFKSNAIA